MYVESTLGVFARIAQLQQVENRLHIGIEAVIALPGERRIAVGERRDGLLGVFVQFGAGRDAFARRVLAVVAFVVEGRGVTLVVRRNDACAERRRRARAVVELPDGVGLCQVLRRVVHVVDDAE